VIFPSSKLNASVKLNSRGTAREIPPPRGNDGFAKVSTSKELRDFLPWVQLPGRHPTKVFPLLIGRLGVPRTVAFSLTSPVHELRL
jgi:hypothetical protein